jgi:uracil-DNA glycosylase
MKKPTASSLQALRTDIAACQICKAHLPLGPRPVVQVDQRARILIAGQAPGRKVHDTGIPFNDPSGDRLRDWMGIDRDTFYDSKLIAIVPMGFCYPGTGSAGDLPPRPECAAKWRQPLLAQLPNIRLTLVIGQYAQAYHLPAVAGSVTDVVAAWRSHWPAVLPMPHPSPRNNRWLKTNPWFEAEVLPALRAAVIPILGRDTV